MELKDEINYLDKEMEVIIFQNFSEERK